MEGQRDRQADKQQRGRTTERKTAIQSDTERGRNTWKDREIDMQTNREGGKSHIERERQTK
jgi:hypothetical protein